MTLPSARGVSATERSVLLPLLRLLMVMLVVVLLLVPIQHEHALAARDELADPVGECDV